MQPDVHPRHSFIVRVWIEETAAGAGRVTWRGSITHFPDQEHRYLRGLCDIVFFIMPFLTQQGVGFGPVWGLSLWLYRHVMGKPPPAHSRKDGDATG